MGVTFNILKQHPFQILMSLCASRVYLTLVGWPSATQLSRLSGGREPIVVYLVLALSPALFGGRKLAAYVTHLFSG